MPEYLRYYIDVVGTPTKGEDNDVPGSYLVVVEDTLDENLRVSAALDIFHANLAIAELEDFTIAVFDSTGNEIQEIGENSGDLKLEKRGEFCGSIHEGEIPRKLATS